MKKYLWFITLQVSFVFSAYSSIREPNLKEELLKKYMAPLATKFQMQELKKETLKYGQHSVEALIEVTKNGKYPDKNRWMATFLLGQVMGEKSAPYLAKFLQHPHWVMRMASLKTLLALKQKNYYKNYAMLLSDESFLVRTQALENIRQLKTVEAAPQVWAMLYDKKNYDIPSINGKPMKSKRSQIIKSVILTIGELKFDKAKGPLITMIQKDRYKDIFPEIDKSLSLITGQASPQDVGKKKIFWQRMRLDTTI